MDFRDAKENNLLSVYIMTGELSKYFLNLCKFFLMTVLILLIAREVVGYLSGGGDSTASRSITEVVECETIRVKYRIGAVTACSDSFKSLPNPSGSVWRALYDSAHTYMIVNLSGTNYHYCRFPNSVWREWSKVGDKYDYYVKNVRGSYDCRANGGAGIPDY